ncbi:hypothetical protein Ancab_003150 [Ancistrocladus abbreviatus]
MQQGDTTNSYYQFYQSHFQNPNPNPNDPQISGNQWPSTSTFASAPPVSTTSYPSSDFPDYSSPYPHDSQNLDHAPNSAPTAPSYPPNNSNPQSSTPFQYSHDQNQPPYHVYDQNQLNYAPSNANHNPNPALNLSYSGTAYSANYDNAYAIGKQQVDCWGGYSCDNADRFKDPGLYGSRYDDEGFHDDGVYRYDGGKVEPYGARGTSKSSSSSQVMFDDYGRPINLSNGKEQMNPVGTVKVVKATPKTETEEDVQKFRVKLLSEGVGQSDMDVLCQIGLDGIQMLEPASGRTLRIYPLETVTRWEVLDPYIFAFWAKTSVDIEPKRIRLKSSSYMTNTILDIVTAASVQLKEMGDRKDSNSLKASDQPVEKKKGFDWMYLIKPPNEEKDHWVPDEAVSKCTSCGVNFGPFVRKHHCRNCGDIFCDKCTQGRTPLTMDEQAQPVRVCDCCMAEVTQRLTNSREAASRIGGLHSHEDLAKKLKEEMDKKLQPSSGSKSETQMREVACPTCTVHLQVQVPTSGSETIECSVCQHPFVVHAQ